MANLFQAIGVIEGDVFFPTKKDEEITIKIENNVFRLLIIPTTQGHKAIGALRGQVANKGTRQKLLVYPKVLHVPDKSKNHRIGFSVVGFYSDNADNTLWDKLEVNEFLISGLFQKIPVCRIPVITVFKNLTEDRIRFVDQANAIVKAGFMKPNHIPIRYDQSVVPAFVFSKDKNKNQQEIKYFIEIKAQFNPHQKIFIFDTLIGLPSEEPPRHMHISKKDKQSAMHEKRRRNAVGTIYQRLQKPPTGKSFPAPKLNKDKDKLFVPPVTKKNK